MAVLVAAYMDDITLFMHHRGITDTLHAATTALANVGLQLNQTKTECWINDTVLPMRHHLQQHPPGQAPHHPPIHPEELSHPTRPRSPSRPVHPR